MIKAREAVRQARALLGTPYSELDCINLMKRVIRTAPGGVPKYTTAGTNSLWRSYDSAPKYRDLTWRQEGLAGAKAGMLAFKRDGEDVHHVGIVAERPQCGMKRGGDRESQGAAESRDYASFPDGNRLTVVHSSSARGCVVETELDGTWQLLARHRYIEVETSPGPSGHPPQGGGLLENGDKEDESMATLYRAMVATRSDPLRVRDAPETGKIIGHVPRGKAVDVLSGGDWPRIRYGEVIGYASADYLTRIADVETVRPGEEPDAPETTTLMREDDGSTIVLGGTWRVAED